MLQIKVKGLPQDPDKKGEIIIRTQEKGVSEEARVAEDLAKTKAPKVVKQSSKFKKTRKKIRLVIK